MKSIERRFNRARKRNPYLGDYPCLVAAVENGNFSRQTISRWFGRLVEEGEYSRKDRKPLISHLCLLSKGPEDDGKRT